MGKVGEFVEKYFRKGMKADITAHIQTGSYQNKDGQTVYTTDAMIEEIDFGESKNNASANTSASTPVSTPAETPADDGFMNVPDDIDDLPFA